MAASCESDAQGYCLFEATTDEYGNRNDYVITASQETGLRIYSPDELRAPIERFRCVRGCFCR